MARSTTATRLGEALAEVIGEYIKEQAAVTADDVDGLSDFVENEISNADIKGKIDDDDLTNAVQEFIKEDDCVDDAVKDYLESHLADEICQSVQEDSQVKDAIGETVTEYLTASEDIENRVREYLTTEAGHAYLVNLMRITIKDELLRPWRYIQGVYRKTLDKCRFWK